MAMHTVNLRLQIKCMLLVMRTIIVILPSVYTELWPQFVDADSLMSSAIVIRGAVFIF